MIDIAAARRAAGMTQVQLGVALAPLLGRSRPVDPSEISHWERGDVQPRTAALAALAEVLHLEPPRAIDTSDAPRPGAPHFGWELRGWRESKGLTQAQAAVLYGVHRLTVYRWERARPKLQRGRWHRTE